MQRRALRTERSKAALSAAQRATRAPKQTKSLHNRKPQPIWGYLPRIYCPEPLAPPKAHQTMPAFLSADNAYDLSVYATPYRLSYNEFRPYKLVLESDK